MTSSSDPDNERDGQSAGQSEAPQKPGGEQPPVANNPSLRLFKKVIAALFLGTFLAAFNFFGGTAAGIACTFGIGSLEGVFPDALTVVVVGLYFANIVFTPVFAFTICWMALRNENPAAWCRKRWWLFLIGFAVPFILISYMTLAGAANA